MIYFQVQGSRVTETYMHNDRAVTFSRGPWPSLPRRLTVTATGAFAEKWPDYLGMFTQTQRWWNGRPVYTNKKGRVLYHGQGWIIGPALGQYVLGGSMFSDNPADINSWIYWPGTGTELKPASVTVWLRIRLAN